MRAKVVGRGLKGRGMRARGGAGAEAGPEVAVMGVVAPILGRPAAAATLHRLQVLQLHRPPGVQLRTGRRWLLPRRRK